MTAEYRRFCRALSAAMRQRNATMRDIETATGISKATVCRAANGKDIKATSFLALARWCGFVSHK